MFALNQAKYSYFLSYIIDTCIIEYSVVGNILPQ